MDQLPASATQKRERERRRRRSRVVLLVDGDVGREVLGDGVYLPRGVAEVLVPVLSELPELRLMVFRIPDVGEKENMYVKTNAVVFRRFNSNATLLFFTEEFTYLSERTGPDFMQPMYTRGFSLCRPRVATSIPAHFTP